MLYIEKKTPPREMARKVSEIKSSPEWKAIKDGNTSAIVTHRLNIGFP